MAMAIEGEGYARMRRAVGTRGSPPSTIGVSWQVASDGVVNPVISHRSARGGARVKMSGGMPELGSKISLISKADIRYEGRLFTVDPQECTIALANGEYDNPRWIPPHHPSPFRRCSQCIAYTEPVSRYEGTYLSGTSRPTADSPCRLDLPY